MRIWLCRDTYPNQHVGITVRALIYRWMDRDAAGVPQVPMHACFSASDPLRELSCTDQRNLVSLQGNVS